MPDFASKLRPVREMLRTMPDADRVRFIANKFIAVWEHDGNFEPGTLPLDEKNYWIENAERLVYLDNGNRDPDTLLLEAYEVIKPYLPRDDDNSLFSIFADIRDLLLEVTAKSLETVAAGAEVVGAGAIEGSKVVLTKSGEFIFGSYENAVYLSIAAGLIGTAVLYLRRS